MRRGVECVDGVYNLGQDFNLQLLYKLHIECEEKCVIVKK